MNRELPPSLTRFGDELERAIGRELGAQATSVAPARRRRRRLALRFGTLLAAVAVAVAVVLSSLASTAGESAWAKQIMQRAAEVLAPARSPGTILHVVATQTESPLALKDGPSVSFLSEEGWLQQGGPWRRRVIVHLVGGPVLEEGNAFQTYNMTSNELYPGPKLQVPNGKPQFMLLAGAKPGSYRLRVKMPHGVYTSTIDSAEAKSIRNGTQTVSWGITWNGRVQQLQPLVMPSRQQMQRLSSEQPNPSSLGFAAQLHGLLSSGHARVTRATTADGKPAIEIASVHPQSGPRTTYYVNPTTYAPIELDRYGFNNPRDVTRVRFSVYQTLPLAGHQRLLRFTTPPNVRVDRTPADYYRWQVLTPF